MKTQISGRLGLRKMYEVAVTVLLSFGLSAADGLAGDLTPAARAGALVDASGVHGGFVVHVGNGDAGFITELRPDERYVVHGLVQDPASVDGVRQTLRTLSVYGPVTVDGWDGRRLPYIDDLVNLLVADVPVPEEEIERVLAPGGVALVPSGLLKPEAHGLKPADGLRLTGWGKYVKPVPPDIDEWTHYLHGPDNNAVALDKRVEPPRRFQWVSEPRWLRHHDRMASMSAMVSAGGRLFHITDEGPRANMMAAPRWRLTAQDAHNGVILWKRDIEKWHDTLWPLKSGPAQLPRRLVAVGERVYVTLGLDAPLMQLDAATGKTLQTYADSRSTEEVLCSAGVLYLLVNDDWSERERFVPSTPHVWTERDRLLKELTWDERPRRLMAVRADTGDVLWNRKRDRVAPMTLACDEVRVFHHDGGRIVALDRKSGNELWQSEPIACRSPLPQGFGPTLVVHSDVVFFSGGKGNMTALSASTGKTLWTKPRHPSGHYCPEDILVIDGLVWTGAISESRDSGVFTGRNPTSGAVEREFPPDVKAYWFHQRCYPSKATERFILPSRTGIEFVDVRARSWSTNHWVRGGCLYGILPCNGMIYAPAHPCACYLDAKLYGMCALKGAEKATKPQLSQEERHVRGPGAEGEGERDGAKRGKPGLDWPTYRCDAARSSSAKTPLPAKLKQIWSCTLPAPLTAATVSAGRVFVCSLADQTVYALDAETGEEAWHFVAGGRVDSPPTVAGDRVFFGSSDGCVYALRASDGALVWRYRAAPADRRMMAYGRVESLWPVHGSVLVVGDQLCFVAGRSRFVDGGMYFCRLEAATGKTLAEELLGPADPKTGKHFETRIRGLDGLPASLPDILSSDGKHVFMRTSVRDMDGRAVSGEGVPHLFSPTGFLDGDWFHRSYFVYGSSFSSGAGGWFKAGWSVPSGRLLVIDEQMVYGFGRRAEDYHWTTPLAYRLFAAPKKPKVTPRPTELKGKDRMFGHAHNAFECRWSVNVPVLARAMLLAPVADAKGKALYVAGPRDNGNEPAAFTAALKGERQPDTEAATDQPVAGLLWVASAGDGSKLSEQALKAPPVWDGMAAAGGRLYLSLEDGTVVCLE